jgi:hypothetical protein
MSDLITINVPVVFSTFWGPKKSRFSGPTPSNAPRYDVAHLKTIKYKRHKIDYILQQSLSTRVFTKVTFGISRKSKF